MEGILSSIKEIYCSKVIGLQECKLEDVESYVNTYFQELSGKNKKVIEKHGQIFIPIENSYLNHQINSRNCGMRHSRTRVIIYEESTIRLRS